MARILIADDDTIVLKVVQATLRQANHDVLTAADGHIALEILEHERVQIVISDAEMPNGISGFDVVATIRGTEKLKHLPVMLLTGLGDKKSVMRALQSGANDYIVKPIDPALLIAKCEALLPAGIGSTGFVELSVQAKGKWQQLSFDLVGISEHGVTLVSPSAIPVNTQIAIESALFQTIRLEKPVLRVWASNVTPNGQYRINASFLGLSNLELQGIRVWMRTHPAAAKKIA